MIIASGWAFIGSYFLPVVYDVGVVLHVVVVETCTAPYDLTGIAVL